MHEENEDHRDDRPTTVGVMTPAPAADRAAAPQADIKIK
jgi:hypothetical protein